MPNEQAPPQIPTHLEQLADAVTVCARASRVRLDKLTRDETARLINYCGALPESKTQAARWKIYLRRLLREARAEPDPEEGLAPPEPPKPTAAASPPSRAAARREPPQVEVLRARPR